MPAATHMHPSQALRTSNAPHNDPYATRTHDAQITHCVQLFSQLVSCWLLKSEVLDSISTEDGFRLLPFSEYSESPDVCNNAKKCRLWNLSENVYVPIYSCSVLASSATYMIATSAPGKTVHEWGCKQNQRAKGESVDTYLGFVAFWVRQDLVLIGDRRKGIRTMHFHGSLPLPRMYWGLYMSHGSTVESLVVRRSNSKLPLIIVIYRPSSAPIAQFFSDVSACLLMFYLVNVLSNWLVNSAFRLMI